MGDSTPFLVNALRNKKHTGLTERVRELLRKSPEPLSAKQIAARLGEPIGTVKSGLNRCVSKAAGGIVLDHRDGRECYYRLMGQAKEIPTGSIQFAGRITIGRGSKWGAGLV